MPVRVAYVEIEFDEDSGGAGDGTMIGADGLMTAAGLACAFSDALNDSEDLKRHFYTRGVSLKVLILETRRAQ